MSTLLIHTHLHVKPPKELSFSVTGGDWDALVSLKLVQAKEERVVVNMGPQHPSTHGVLRLVLELEGETVTEVRCRNWLPAHGY